MAQYTKQLHFLRNGTQNDIKLYTSLSDVVDASLINADGTTGGITLYTSLSDVVDASLINADGTTGGITLYTSTSDVEYPYLRLMEGDTPVYAALELLTASNTSESGLKVSAGGNTYVVKKEAFPAKGKALNSYTWKQISKIALSGKGAEYFNIGDCKEITLNGNVGSYLTLSNAKLCVFILDFNHAMNGTAENNIIFGGFKTALIGGTDVALADDKYQQANSSGTIMFSMNHWSGYNYGGWKGCDLRYDVLGATSTPPSDYGKPHTTSCVGYDATAATLTNPKANTLLAALPVDLRSNMRLWTRYVDAVGNSSDVDANIKATVDAITLLAEPEIFASRTHANRYEYNHNTRMAYYANGNGTIKKKHSDVSTPVDWWESSPNYNLVTVCIVNATGNADYDSAHGSFALSPAFKI